MSALTFSTRQPLPSTRHVPSLFLMVQLAVVLLGADGPVDYSPRPAERQLPRRMHSPMAELPRIRVGQAEGDLVGKDQRVLQAAMDYVAGLGGGVLEIGPGEYAMRDSLHLRSGVTVRGVAGKTVLRKADAAVSALAIDGDFGEEQITLVDPVGFAVGDGVAVWSSRVNGFHVTVARITGRDGNTFALDRPLNADCMVSDGAEAATVFPVLSGYDLEGVRLEDLVIEGNREGNGGLDGCRGGGIFLYRGFGTAIERCVVRNYHGDGISFQQSNDVVVQDCVSEGNAGLGLHPGSGSQRAMVRRCVARGNGADGLFLCWRVRHGVFEENLLEGNGRYGVSIGHKDSDNLLRANAVRGNAEEGIFFRNETLGMAGHRNVLEENLVENNGSQSGTAGIRVRGETRDVVLRGNRIRDTRPVGERTQTVGIRLDELVGPVTLEGNQVEAEREVVDGRVGDVR